MDFLYLKELLQNNESDFERFLLKQPQIAYFCTLLNDIV